jgi:hypothetical protein
MVRRANPFPIRPVGLGAQLASMKATWRSFDSRIRGRTLECRGSVQPTPLHSRYAVKLLYTQGRLPEAWVEDPVLRRRSEDEAIPHVYEGPRPCLFYPKAREWRSDMFVADTILPWLLVWLFHYEIWLVTGDWDGGGIHHGPAGGSR